MPHKVTTKSKSREWRELERLPGYKPHEWCCPLCGRVISCKTDLGLERYQLEHEMCCLRN